jgi:glycerol-3-phosphate dehydrogenase (NAD(P)+)
MSAISMKGVSAAGQALTGVNHSRNDHSGNSHQGARPRNHPHPLADFPSGISRHAITVLSGPNLSKEIEQGLPAATVIACENETAAEAVQHVFAGENFRTYRSTDPLGAELGGTLKNVIAIAVGVCEGLELGSNARSALITRALPEVMRIGTHLGGNPKPSWGCRDWGICWPPAPVPSAVTTGLAMGWPRANRLEQILDELGSTAEGVNTAHVLMDIAKREHISVPISQQVHLLLNGEISAEEAVAALMERKLKAENYQEVLQAMELAHDAGR